MGLIEGAGIALVFFLLGRFMPGRSTAPRLPEAVCGCEHHYSMHDPLTGKCNAAARVGKYDARGNWIGYDHQPCACLRYSGPEPLPEYVPREIAEG